MEVHYSKAMSDTGALRRSIAAAVFGLAAAQIGLTVVLAVIYGFSVTSEVLFVAVCLAFHGLLLAVLLHMRGFFVLNGSGEPLERINVSNVLSLFRLSSLPTLVFLLIVTHVSRTIFSIVPLIVLVFMSDLFDGYLARKLRQVTVIGQHLDSTTDYLVLFSLSVVLLSYGGIPLWFFLLLFVRLLLVTAGKAYIYFAHRRIEPRSSYLGRASVFSVMVVFAGKALDLVLELAGVTGRWSAVFSGVVDKLLFMSAGILVASLCEKVRLLREEIRSGRERSRSPNV